MTSRTTLITAALLLLTSVSARAATKAAQVVTITGVAKMTAPGVASKALVANDEIPEGAVIRTERGAAVKLLFTDDSIMDIGADSEFKVDEYLPGNGSDRKGLFSLAYGSLRTLVAKPVGDKGSYKVKTRDAIMGVRGTEFAVMAPRTGSDNAGGSSSAPTSIVVASGSVSLSGLSTSSAGSTMGAAMAPATGSATVAAGQSFSTTQFSASSGGSGGGAAAQPTTLSAGQLQNTMSGARVADTSFSSAVSLDGGSSSGSSSGGGSTASGSAVSGSQSQGAPPSGPRPGGNMALAAATGAVANTVSVGSGTLIGGMNLGPPVPNGVSIRDVITAPPVNILPGSQRTVTIIIQ